MLVRRWLLVLLAWGMAAGGLRAAETIPWAADVPQARQQAAQSGRLVLLHFWAPWCGPCRRLEKTVFTRPSVAQALQRHFVAVKVNVDRQPALARKYGVRQIPCDVVITPGGQVVGKTISPSSASAYSSKLIRIAQRAIPGPPATHLARNAPTAGPSRTTAASQRPQPGAAAVSAAAPAAPAVPIRRRYAQGVAAPWGGPSSPAGTVSAGRAAAPPRLPWPLALDGYCVVTLVEQGRWVRGNPQFGVRHRGQLYLFAGLQQKERFWQNPEGYAPVLSGYDVVMYLEQGQLVPGKRRHGVFYQGRIYLFANELSLRKFEQQPERYAPEVLRRVAMMDQWSRSQRR